MKLVAAKFCDSAHALQLRERFCRPFLCRQLDRVAVLGAVLPTNSG
jgi:hypothetical protein